MDEKPERELPSLELGVSAMGVRVTEALFVPGDVPGEAELRVSQGRPLLIVAQARLDAGDPSGAVVTAQTASERYVKLAIWHLMRPPWQWPRETASYALHSRNKDLVKL